MSQSGQPTPETKLTTVARKSDRELVVSRAFDSPIGAVFDAWTRPELFRLWWAPRSMGAALSACEIDARTSDDAPVTTVTFEDEGERTLLVLSELYPSAEPVADALAGMQAMSSEQFAQLDELLASRRPSA
jgi:hypothetical protein